MGMITVQRRRLAIPTTQFDQGTLYELLKHASVDVGEALDVQAGLTHLVPAELAKQGGLFGTFCDQVDRNLILPGCKASSAGISLTTALVLVVVRAKPDDAGAPHHWVLLGPLDHEICQCLAVSAYSLVLD